MGSTYTRQSTFTDGDTITADLFNTEFDQLVAAFAATSGHSHDGTAGEGGPIGGLITPGITLGDNTIDVTLTFDGGSNDGVLKWMEDEDYFEFSDDILIASTEKLQFRDTAIYINSSADGQLDIVADTEIQIAATTIDINGNAAYSTSASTAQLVYGGPTQPLVRQPVEGSGFSVALKVEDGGSSAAYSLKGFQLEYQLGARR